MEKSMQQQHSWCKLLQTFINYFMSEFVFQFTQHWKCPIVRIFVVLYFFYFSLLVIPSHPSWILTQYNSPRWNETQTREANLEKYFPKRYFSILLNQNENPGEGWQWTGPSGIKNFNPGIFRDGIFPNPEIPGFLGTGFPNIFDPGI